MSLPPEGETGNGRFRSKPPAAGASHPRLDPTPEILYDLRELIRDARLIVNRGRDSFIGTEGRLDRHAADAIIIKVQELCGRLPSTFRDQYPDVNWVAIRGTRNRIGHNYRATDYRIVWNVLVDALPELVKKLDA